MDDVTKWPADVGEAKCDGSIMLKRSDLNKEVCGNETQGPFN